MKFLSRVLLLALLTGCASRHTVKRYDAIDGVTIEQMVGNRIAPRPFTKELICLNARREVSAATGRKDHYLYTELISTTGFTAAPGESLVLAIDGERHAFTATNSATVFVPRPGYEAALYPASPEVFVKIANAREVKVRLKGNNHVLEEKMTRANIRQFREYLVKYYQTADAGQLIEQKAPAKSPAKKSQPKKS